MARLCQSLSEETRKKISDKIKAAHARGAYKKMRDYTFNPNLKLDEDVIVQAMWCIRCYGEKKKKKAAQFVYNGYSVCEACLKEIGEVEKGNESRWRYSVGL